MALLGSIMQNPDHFVDVSDMINAGDFYKTANAKIFSAMCELYDLQQPIDLITLSNTLKARGQLEETGGTFYLTEVQQSTPSGANWSAYAQIVMEKALARRAIKTLSEGVEGLYAEQPFEWIAEDIGKMISSAITHTSDDPTMAENLHELHEDIDRKKEQAITGIPCGLRSLDDLTDGFQKGELIVVAGRPSHGKTAFVTRVACNAAIYEKIPVGIFSLEMSRKQMTARIAALYAGVNLFHLLKGKLTPCEWELYSKAVKDLTSAPFVIDDASNVPIEYLRAKARRWKQQRDIGLVIIDYLELIAMPARIGLVEGIGIVTKSLKALSKELDIPVVLVCQLSRDMEKGNT